MGKKNLDKLFHKKLKDFSEVPDNKVWQSIEASLDKKKKSRKVIPIWWKLGGVAAILIMGVFLWNPFENASVNLPAVTDVNNSTKKTSEENETNQTFEIQDVNEHQIVNTQKTGISNRDDISNDENRPSNKQLADKNEISNEGLKLNSVKKQKEVLKTQNTTAIKIAGVDAHKTTEQENVKTTRKEFDIAVDEIAIADSKSSNTKTEENSSDEGKTDVKVRPISNDRDAAAKEGIAQVEKNDSDKVLEEESKKKSIFDEIAEQEQEEVIVKNSTSKWSAGPSIAPVYFNAIGEGSPVHSIFVPNNKSGGINLSYGLSVAYDVSKKLSIKSGIHKVDYGYRTNDVEFSSSLESAINGQIDNIDYSLTSKSIVVNSKASTRVESSNQDAFMNTISEDVSAVSALRDGEMEQRFGYLEVPIELNYALLNKKFGINLIGGVSSLFLVDNSISLSSGELTTDVGEANNINAVNFSTNVGFGLNYKFTPKVQLNIEPVFKYQLNAFSQTDGTFNPFSVGVYSGLSFKF